MKDKCSIEVCFTPLLFHLYKNTKVNVVIVDILRASSSICTAFMNGAKNIIPVKSLEEAKKYKDQGFLIAAERDGIVVDFADFGNSPHNFTKNKIYNKTIVYSTTNGTKAIHETKDCFATTIGSFLNLQATCNWLAKQNKDVVIFCSGWKNKFNIEDTLYSGALAECLLSENVFYTNCDSTLASIDLWKTAKRDLSNYITKISWLKRLVMPDVLNYCIQTDITDCIPLLKGDEIHPFNP